MTWSPGRHPAVAVPIGGIGTGSMALGVDGGWRQIQLHNVGHHRGDLPGTFMALRVMQHEPVHDTSVILQQLRDDPGARGRPATAMFDDDLVPEWQRRLLEHVGGTRATFSATYPVAEVSHEFDAPVSVVVRAFSPFVPGDLDASGRPVVMVEAELTNTSDAVVRTWLGHSVHNAVGLDPHVNPDGVRAPGYGGNTNTFRRTPDGALLVCDNPSVPPDSPWWGQQVLACDAERVVALPNFSRPEELPELLRTLAPWGDLSRGVAAPWLQNPQLSGHTDRHGPSPAGETWLGALIAYTELQPGETGTVRFALSWWFPNRMVDFVQFGPERPELGATRFWLGNHYTRVWPDAVSVAVDSLRRWEQLRAEVRQWVDALDELPLPELWRTHLAAQPVPLRTPTTFRAFDGACYGFEGVLGASTRMWSGDVGGSCPLNCTHVWNYAMAAAALFPAWERSMRETEFDVMLTDDGVLPHRVYVPTYLHQLGEGPIGGPMAPALDGMCGAVLKVYRELRRGAVDIGWVRHRWARLCRLMDHIAKTWDPHDTGLLHGIQPSTHDIDLHGANPYMGTFWLAALRAAEELAGLLGDHERAAAWSARFHRASHSLDETCFQGGYYVQVPDPQLGLEHQWGRGCLTDQLIGQWWAHELDLGHLLPADHVRQALRAIVQHNLTVPGGHGQRSFATAGERGLVMCTWPGGGRPETPTWYCDEVWTGSEYQVAAHCLREGLVDEAEAILTALWERHDGRRRNPFNHAECGDHYARAMAGWSVLEAAVGLHWSQHDGVLKLGREATVPLVTGSGWGTVSVADDTVRIRSHHGRLPVRRVEVRGQAYLEGGGRWRKQGQGEAR